jgi:hypothetical protein
LSEDEKLDKAFSSLRSLMDSKEVKSALEGFGEWQFDIFRLAQVWALNPRR